MGPNQLSESRATYLLNVTIERISRMESNEEDAIQGEDTSLGDTSFNTDSEDDTISGEGIDRGLLENIPVSISVEVGRTTIKIRDLMRLTQGSVVELERLAGEPLDLYANGTLIARGEVVLVNERYGVRLTSVVSAADRLRSL